VISGIFTHVEEKGWFSGRNPANFVKLREMERRPVCALSFQELKDSLSNAPVGAPVHGAVRLAQKA
jgi:hypothetical protein